LLTRNHLQGVKTRQTDIRVCTSEVEARLNTIDSETGRIFTVHAHAEREPSRILILPIPGFPSFDFYNAVLPFPVAGKVWKRDWRFGLIGANPNGF
jgi:hypothetical protein